MMSSNLNRPYDDIGNDDVRPFNKQAVALLFLVLVPDKAQEKRAHQHQMAGEACSPTPKGRRSVLANAKRAGEACSPAPKRRNIVLAIARELEQRARHRQMAGASSSPMPQRRNMVLANANGQQQRARQRQQVEETSSQAPKGEKIMLASACRGQENRPRQCLGARKSCSPSSEERKNIVLASAKGRNTVLADGAGGS